MKTRMNFLAAICLASTVSSCADVLQPENGQNCGAALDSFKANVDEVHQQLKNLLTKNPSFVGVLSLGIHCQIKSSTDDDLNIVV